MRPKFPLKIHQIVKIIIAFINISISSFEIYVLKILLDYNSKQLLESMLVCSWGSVAEQTLFDDASIVLAQLMSNLQS